MSVPQSRIKQSQKIPFSFVEQLLHVPILPVTLALYTVAIMMSRCENSLTALIKSGASRAKFMLEKSQGGNM